MCEPAMWGRFCIRHGWWVWLSQLLRTIAITLAVGGLIATVLIWYGWVP